VSAGQLTLANNTQLLIPTGHGFTPGNNVTAFDIDGTYNGTSVNGSWDNSGTASLTGLVTFAGTGSQTLTTGGTGLGNDFAQLTVGKSSGSLTLTTNDLLVTRALTLSGGTLVQSSGRNVTVDSFTQNGDAYTGGDSTIDIASSIVLNAGTFTSTSGGLFVSGGWSNSGATFNHNSGTVEFDGTGSQNFNVAAPETFNNVTINMPGVSGLEFSGTDVLSALGTLTFDDGYVDGDFGGVLEAQGNVVLGLNYSGGNALLRFAGAGNQTFNGTGANNVYNGNVVVDKTAGKVDQLSNLTLDSTGQSLTIVEGTWDLNGFNLPTVNAGVTVQDGGNFQLEGGESFVVPTLNSGSTVTYDGTSS